MQRTLDEKIARAKELLETVRHAAMATVNEDGSPHNTPYFFVCSANLTCLYWSSHPESEHSKNVDRTGQVFVVLYDAFQRGGLFIRADQARIAVDTELDESLAEYNCRRTLHGRDPLPRNHYQGDGPQQMYVAETRQFWVNASERDADGLVIRDIRTEIFREALLEGPK